MTENEAIKIINDKYETFFALSTTNVFDIAMATAIKALEEIQQYRAIGTVEEITNLINFLSFDDDTSILEDLRMLVEYYAIGTIEEFKAYKQGNCTNNCKHYDSAIEYVRNKAIDEFAHQLKETLNQEFPSNYESTRPYFSLENARLIVDDVAEQMKAGGKNE